MPVPVAARSKALVCGRSLAEIVGSNPTGGMDVCLLWYCVLSGRGLCDELITRPEDSYRLWCVVVCDLETSKMRRPWPALGRSATGKKTPTWCTKFCFTISLFHTCTCFEHHVLIIRRSVALRSLWYHHRCCDLLMMSTCARNMYRHEINLL